MWKKPIGFLLCLVLLFLPTMNVNAAENESQKTIPINTSIIEQDSVILPLFAYTRSTYTSLSILSGTASCVTSLTGYQGTTTNVEITMYLEKRFLFFWLTETSWSGTFNSYSGSMYEQHSVSGGTYRVKAVYVAYNGTASETITEYSSTVTY